MAAEEAVADNVATVVYRHQDSLDHPDHRDRQEAMANPEDLDSPDKMPHRHHHPMAAVDVCRNVNKHKMDSPVRLVHPDQTAILANLDNPYKVADKDHRDRPDRLDHLANPVDPDNPDSQDSLDNSRKDHHNKDHPVHLDPTDSLEDPDSLASPEILDSPEDRDHPAMVDHPVDLASLVNPEVQANPVLTAAMVLATTAHRHVPRQAIKKRLPQRGKKDVKKKKWKREDGKKPSKMPDCCSTYHQNNQNYHASLSPTMQILLFVILWLLISAQAHKKNTRLHTHSLII